MHKQRKTNSTIYYLFKYYCTICINPLNAIKCLWPYVKRKCNSATYLLVICWHDRLLSPVCFRAMFWLDRVVCCKFVTVENYSLRYTIYTYTLDLNCEKYSFEEWTQWRILFGDCCATVIRKCSVYRDPEIGTSSISGHCHPFFFFP